MLHIRWIATIWDGPLKDSKMKIIFWISLFIAFYTFFGYGILMYFLIKIRRAVKGKRVIADKGSFTPTLTMVIAAYNEAVTLMSALP